MDLSDWAESAFEVQCSVAGVTRNKSSQDRTGWDYIVEFPPLRLAGLPNGRPAISLKLTNALRFAKEPAPCFLVLFLAVHGALPVRIFAKHFWTAEIEHTLRRGREAGESDEGSLALQSLTISFAPEDEHTDDLIAWMDRTVHGFGDRYADVKGVIGRTAGHGDGTIHGSISFLESDLAALVDHQIGLSPTAPVANVTVKQLRFGIDSPTPLFSAKPDIVHIRVYPKACRVRIRGDDGATHWLDGDFFAPSIPDLPEALFKFRVVADFLEIIVVAGEAGVIHFRFGREDPRSLEGLETLASVLLRSARGPLDVQIFFDGTGVWGAHARIASGIDKIWLENLLNIVDLLKRVTKGVEPADLRLSMHDILSAWNPLVDFSALVFAEKLEATINCAESIAGPINGKTLLAYDYVEVGDWSFLAVASRPVTLFTALGRQLRLTCGEPKVREALVRRGKAAPWLEEIRKLYGRAVAMSGPDTVELFGGDFRAMRAGLPAME